MSTVNDKANTGMPNPFGWGGHLSLCRCKEGPQATFPTLWEDYSKYTQVVLCVSQMWHLLGSWRSAELLCEHPLQSGCWMISSGVGSRTPCLNLPHKLKISSKGVKVYFPSIKQQLSTDENTNHLAQIYPNCYS